MGQLVWPPALQPAAIPGDVSRSGGVDQYRWLRQWRRRRRGLGWYDRETNREGALLSQEITEFTNSGVSAGIACVNLSPAPLEDFDGFYAAHSTYASFSYLKYGLDARLFSQIAQDSNIKVGKVLWVAGHSGPETAEDSRTHFGIYETAVMELFPEGHVINIIPWEHNEVPVLIAAAMATDAHIVALHLTRPPIEVPIGGAGHGIAFRGGAGRVPDSRLHARAGAHGHDSGAGDDVHVEHRADFAEARRVGAETWLSRGGEPGAVPLEPAAYFASRFCRRRT